MKCCRFGASSVYTIQPCTSLQCHFIQSHIDRVYVCLAVTCHLRFWQNDGDLLRATAVTRGWNGYRNKTEIRVSRESSVYTIQPCTRLQCHFIQSHIGRVYACLAVTCHLHFWQNDRDLLCATAVTRGWNGYRNKNQHSKSSLETKILPPLLPGLEPGTFRSRVRLSNH